MKLHRKMEYLHHDLVTEILTRLPAKSLGRFSCVSTFWYNAINFDRMFVQSHLSRSQSKSPRDHLNLIFNLRYKYSNTYLFSTIPATTTSAVQSLPPSAVHLKTIRGFDIAYVSKSVQGLICFKMNIDDFHIFNPTTRKFITLPRIKLETPHYHVSCEIKSFGFDPVNNEHKVLASYLLSTIDDRNTRVMEHWVFNVESNKGCWKRINGSPVPPHYLGCSQGVCINGVIYYLSQHDQYCSVFGILVGFDVAREEFHWIELPDGHFLTQYSILIQCDKHLAIVQCEGLEDGNNFDIWVLNDEGNSRWTKKKTIVLPDTWSDIKVDRELYLAGTISTNELIFVPQRIAKPFYVFCYDMKGNSLRRVEIFGLPDFENNSYYPFPKIIVSEHVESILRLVEPGSEND